MRTMIEGTAAAFKSDESRCCHRYVETAHRDWISTGSVPQRETPVRLLALAPALPRLLPSPLNS